MSAPDGRKSLRLTLMAAAAAVLWMISILYGLRLMQLPQGTALRYHTPQLGMEQLDSLRKAEAEQVASQLAFSAYVQLEDQVLEANGYDKEERGSVIAFDGDIGHFLNPEGLTGAFTSSADTQGCAMDADTAYRLWGSENVTGEKIVWDKEEYIVRTVFRSPKGTVLIPLKYSSRAKAAVLVLDTQGLPNPRKAAEEFILRHGLAEPNAVTTGAWQPGAARFFMLLPALAYVALLLAGMVREVWRIRGTPVLCALWCIGIAGAMALLVWLSGIRLSMPQSLIPTRWSDFTFWERTISTWWGNLRDGVLTPKLIPDVDVLVPFGITAVCGLSASLLVLRLIHILKPEKHTGEESLETI